MNFGWLLAPPKQIRVMVSLMVGLEKNVLAGLDYRLWMVFVLSFLLILGMFAPWVAVFLTSGVTQVLYGMILVLLLIIFLRTTVELRVRTSCVFWFPVVLLLFNYIIWRATILTYVQGGIRWRDTFYPLSELRKNQV